MIVTRRFFSSIGTYVVAIYAENKILIDYLKKSYDIIYHGKLNFNKDDSNDEFMMRMYRIALGFEYEDELPKYYVIKLIDILKNQKYRSLQAGKQFTLYLRIEFEIDCHIVNEKLLLINEKDKL